MTKTELIVAWFEGRYALGWRGHLAMWLLNPVLNEVFIKFQKKKQLKQYDVGEWVSSIYQRAAKE